MLSTICRVLFVTGEFPPRRGGISDHVVRLRAAFEAQGVQTDIATESVVADDPEDGVYRTLVSPWGRQVLKVARLARQFRSDVVHIQYQAGAFASPLQPAMLPMALRLTGYSGLVAVTFHDLAEPYLFPRAGPLRRLAMDLLRGSADVCIYVDAYDRAKVDMRNPDEHQRSHVVPVGPTIERPSSAGTRAGAREILGLPQNIFLIGFFGFRQVGKGLDSLAEAMRMPELARSGTRLALIGAATPDAGSRRAAAALSPETFAGLNVLDTGPLESREVSTWLCACDVAALPYDEGLSTRRGTFMVATAHGLPVVTTKPRRPDLLEIRDGEVAFIAAGDARALALKLARVRNDSVYRAELESGARAVAQRYSWRRIARRTLDAYSG